MACTQDITQIAVKMVGDMDKLLEEFGKWFLNFALAISIAFVIQPLAKGSITLEIATKAVVVILIFLAFGGVLLYLSKKVGREND